MAKKKLPAVDLEPDTQKDKSVAVSKASDGSLPTHLSADHLLQLERLSGEIRVAEVECKLQRALLEKAALAQALARTEVEKWELQSLKQLSSTEDLRKKRTALINELKGPYQIPDKFSYCPDTGEIYRD